MRNMREKGISGIPEIQAYKLQWEFFKNRKQCPMKCTVEDMQKQLHEASVRKPAETRLFKSVTRFL